MVVFIFRNPRLKLCRLEQSKLGDLRDKTVIPRNSFLKYPCLKIKSHKHQPLKLVNQLALATCREGVYWAEDYFEAWVLTTMIKLSRLMINHCKSKK
jgi:hypothetical protein